MRIRLILVVTKNLKKFTNPKRKYSRTKLENMKKSRTTRSHFTHARSCLRALNQVPTRAKTTGFHPDVFFVKRRYFSFCSSYGI